MPIYLTTYLKLAVLAVLFVLFSCPTFAQENYQPAYVVLPSGDTLTGRIDYRNWDKNPDKISFRSEANDNERTYTPADIRSFGVQDEVYVAAEVPVEMSPFRTDALSHSPTVVLENTSAFLQTVIDGPKSLFYYKGDQGNPQLYIKQGDSFDLLIYKRYLTTRKGKRVIAENQKYLGQLALYLQDCPRLQNKIDGVTYGRRSVESLFRFYYDCTSSAVDFQKETEGLAVAFGVVAGATASALTFNSDYYDYLTQIDYPRSVSVSAGISLNLLLPRNFRKWSFYNELFYTSYRTEGSYREIINPDQYATFRAELAYAYLKLNTMMRYAHPVGNSQFFINGGMSNGFAVSETNERITERYAYGNAQLQEASAMEGARQYEQGYLIGLGAQLGRYSLEARYERANGMSPFTVLESAVRRYHLLLGYRF